MNRRVLLVRTGPIVLMAALGTLVLSRSSLLGFLPVEVTPYPVGLVAFLALLAMLMPALLARGSPLPAALAVTAPVVVLASYGASRLDWLRTLKDFGVQESSGIDFARLGLSGALLLAAFALHALDFAARLRLRSDRRGIPPAQARGAARVSLAWNATAAALALAGATLLGAIALASTAWAGDAFATGRAALVAPLAAGLLLAVAALLLARGRRSDPRP